MISNAASADDDSAVAAVLDEVYAAWAAGDADAFVAPYAEHATAVLPGSYLQDKEAIRATMADGFTGPLKGSRGIHQVQSIRFPGADAAIVISKGGIVWSNTTLMKGSVDEFVAELRQQDGGTIGTAGSPSLVRSLIAHGLLDELTLMVSPVVAGGGRKRLFPEDTAATKFELVEGQPTSSGTLIATYRPIR